MNDSKTATLNRGFTLVELLVVGGALMVLAAVLPPALVSTRERARNAQCLANLHRINEASMIYAAADPGENGIPTNYIAAVSMSVNQVRLGNYAYGGKSGIGGSTVSTTHSFYGAANYMGSLDRPLNATLYPAHQKSPFVPGGRGGTQLSPADTQIAMRTYQCPSDTGYQGQHYDWWAQHLSISSYDFFGTSYSANAFWTGTGGATCRLASNSAFLRPLSAVPVPGETIMYMENVGRYCWSHHDPASSTYGGPFGDILAVPSYPEYRGGPEWHGQGWYFNTAFADGAVRTIRMKSYIPVKPYPGDMRGMCSGAAGNETGPCTWIMIRAPGWRLDTLPAEPVPTNIPCPAAGRPCQDSVGLVGWPSG